MTIEDLAQIGAILHRGRHNHHSMTPSMARVFMEELDKIGFVIVPKEPTMAMAELNIAELLRERTDQVHYLTLENKRLRAAATDYLLEQTDENAGRLADVLGWQSPHRAKER